MTQYISIIQIILSLLLIITVLLQQRGGGLGSAFGSGGGSEVYSTRRGVEKVLFAATIIIAVLFVITAIARIII